MQMIALNGVKPSPKSRDVSYRTHYWNFTRTFENRTNVSWRVFSTLFPIRLRKFYEIRAIGQQNYRTELNYVFVFSGNT